ncbi:mCG1048517 [Mus musculus]|nr:mCG1048517 [Mus musculus]
MELLKGQAAAYRRTFCSGIWREIRFSLLGCPIFSDQAEFASIEICYLIKVDLHNNRQDIQCRYLSR